MHVLAAIIELLSCYSKYKVSTDSVSFQCALCVQLHYLKCLKLVRVFAIDFREELGSNCIYN